MFAAASPASRSVPLAPAAALTIRATSGPKCLESFARFERPTWWARTFAACLLSTPFSSKLCVLSWKLKATTFNRFYFQLRVSALPTSATAFGLLPTPTTDSAYDRNAEYAQGGMPLAYAVKLLPTPQASDSKRGAAEAFVNERGKVERKSVTANGRAFAPQLTDVVKFLPTPTASSADQSATYYGGNLTLRGALLLPTPTVSGNHNRKGLSKKSGDGLSTAVKGMLGTPRASNAMAKPLKPTGKDSKSRLEQQVAEQEQASGSLNPRFVAQMMGFPPDWCELP